MNGWQEYLDTLESDKREIVEEILTVAQGLESEATPAMPYGVPGLTLNGKSLIAVAAHKAHYGIYPFSPKVIEQLRDELKNLETAKGTIRFSYDEKPSKKLLKQIINLRKEEI